MLRELPGVSGRMAVVAGAAHVRVTRHALMERVHQVLAVLVAHATFEHALIARFDVTGQALIPGVVVRSRIDREELRVVVDESPGFAARMAIVTGRTHIRVAGDPLVCRIHERLIVLVAIEA